jgi:hypothetical protein
MAGMRSSHWALLAHLVGTGERSRSVEPRDDFAPSQIIVSHLVPARPELDGRVQKRTWLDDL